MFQNIFWRFIHSCTFTWAHNPSATLARPTTVFTSFTGLPSSSGAVQLYSGSGRVVTLPHRLQKNPFRALHLSKRSTAYPTKQKKNLPKLTSLFARHFDQPSSSLINIPKITSLTRASNRADLPKIGFSSSLSHCRRTLGTSSESLGRPSGPPSRVWGLLKKTVKVASVIPTAFLAVFLLSESFRRTCGETGLPVLLYVIQQTHVQTSGMQVQTLHALSWICAKRSGTEKFIQCGGLEALTALLNCSELAPDVDLAICDVLEHLVAFPEFHKLLVQQRFFFFLKDFIDQRVPNLDSNFADTLCQVLLPFFDHKTSSVATKVIPHIGFETLHTLLKSASNPTVMSEDIAGLLAVLSEKRPKATKIVYEGLPLIKFLALHSHNERAAASAACALANCAAIANLLNPLSKEVPHFIFDVAHQFESSTSVNGQIARLFANVTAIEQPPLFMTVLPSLLPWVERWITWGFQESTSAKPSAKNEQIKMLKNVRLAGLVCASNLAVSPSVGTATLAWWCGAEQPNEFFHPLLVERDLGLMDLTASAEIHLNTPEAPDNSPPSLFLHSSTSDPHLQAAPSTSSFSVKSAADRPVPYVQLVRLLDANEVLDADFVTATVRLLSHLSQHVDSPNFPLLFHPSTLSLPQLHQLLLLLPPQSLSLFTTFFTHLAENLPEFRRAIYTPAGYKTIRKFAELAGPQAGKAISVVLSWPGTQFWPNGWCEEVEEWLEKWVRSGSFVETMYAVKAWASLRARDISGPKYDEGVYLLWPNATPLEPLDYDFDIVLLHGVAGHPIDTWVSLASDTQSDVLKDVLFRKSPTKPAASAQTALAKAKSSAPSPQSIQSDATQSQIVVWPREWLPKVFPKARIISIGYDLYLSKWAGSGLPMEEQAAKLVQKLKLACVGQKPVVFIVHSWGGLLLKFMLSEIAQSKEAYSDLAKNTRGIVFFSTPHRGSPVAKLATPYVDYVFYSNEPIQELKPENVKLLQLHDKFEDLFADTVPTLSFGENDKTCIGNYACFQVVTDESANPSFRKAPHLHAFHKLDLNHRLIAKPASEDSVHYQLVVEFLKSLNL